MAGYWEKNWQDFTDALTPNVLKGASTPPSSVAPSVYGPGTQSAAPTGLRALAAPPLQSAGAGPRTQGFQTPIGPQPAPSDPSLNNPEGPTPILQPDGRKQVVQSIPVGRYGWKGTSESLRPGQPTLTLGGGFGTDGGGTGSWAPGSARLGGLRVAGPAAATARFTPQVQAPAFAQPEKSPLDISIENLDRINASRPNAAPGGQPQYLGPESGLGWKTRLGLYKEQMDAYNAGLNRENALAVAGLNRSTAMDAAGLRALVDREQIAAGAGLRDAQAQEATSKAAAGLRLSNAAAALQAAKPGTTEYGAALRDYLVLSGQGAAAVKDPKQNIEKIAEKDAFGNTVRERLVRINPDGTSTDVVDATPGAQDMAELNTIMSTSKARADEWAKATPEQKAGILAQYRASKQQGK